jgi:CheY-like chemotaxis protein
MADIMVVEDERDIREMLGEALRDAGYEVVEAATAEAAVQMLGSENLRLIVTDINLPGRLNGIDLAVAARQFHPDIPVIFVSGRPANLLAAHVVGNPVAFLQKPFSFPTLIEHVRRLAPRGEGTFLKTWASPSHGLAA